MVKIYLQLVCTLHPEIFSLGEVIGTVPAWEDGESFPCAIIYFLGGKSFPSARIRLDNCYSFPSWKGESFPCVRVRLHG
jgi:hypothetical protein